MTSKVIKINYQNNILILILLCINLHEVLSSFGNEFVHIKVHIPTEIVEPPEHVVHVPVSSHPKVVHHYHQRKRKPEHKNPFAKHAGLLESILLTELKEPLSNDHYKYLHNADNIIKTIDNFVVKNEKPKPHVETYEIIEEKKPEPIVETYKIIESKVPSDHFHHDKYNHHHDPDIVDEIYNYEPKDHTETYKIIDDLLSDYHTNFKDSDVSYFQPKKSHVKNVEIIDSHEPVYEHNRPHYGYHSSLHDNENDYISYENRGSNNAYNYGSKAHTDTVEIVETQTPHHHSKEYSINFGKRPHSETVEIIKSNLPPKSSSYYKSYEHPHHHYDDRNYYYEDTNSHSVIEENYPNRRPQSSYHDSYGAIESDHYSPESSYLPEKTHGNSYHRHHHHYHKHYSTEPQNDLDHNEAKNPIEIDSYYPSPYPSQINLHHANKFSGSYGIKSKATETYTGFNSYKAPHVQGVTVNDDKYSPPYL